MNKKSNESFREFLKTIYSEKLIDLAFKYCEKCIKSKPSELAKCIIDKWPIEDEALKTSLLTCLEIEEKSIFRGLVYAYLDGARDYKNLGLFDISPEPEENSEFIRDLDFAFIFEYHDNDFSSIIWEAGLKVEKLVEEYISDINRNFRIDGKYDHNVEDLKMILKPENIITMLKTLAHSEYMCGKVDRCYANKNDYSFEKNLDGANHIIIDYLKFDQTDFIFGTCQEIDDYLNQNYLEPSFENPEVKYLWNNGESLVFKLKNGKVDIQTL